MNHLEESFSFQTGDLEEGEVFFFLRPLLRWIRGRIKLIEIRKRPAFRSSPREAKEFWNWFWLLKDETLLLCWVASQLYQFGRVCPDAPQWWQKCGFFRWDIFLAEWWLLCLVSFLTILGGALRMDLHLSFLSLITISILGLFILD